MTARDFLAMARARWYVVVVGMAATLGALVLAHAPSPVYWGRVTVIVLAPVSPTSPNSLQDQGGVTATASVLVTRVNDGHEPVTMSDPSATLYGEGVRQGTRVTVRNIGGQWRAEYRDPNIDVEAVDSSAEATTGRLNSAIGALQRELDTLQDELRIGPGARMTITAEPRQVSTVAIPSSAKRATVGLAVLGALATAIAVTVVDRWRRREP